MVGRREQDSTSATRLKPSPVKLKISKKPPLKGGFFVPENLAHAAGIQSLTVVQHPFTRCQDLSDTRVLYHLIVISI